MFKKILVGTDGSDSATKAVSHAADMAAAMGAELVLIHIYPSARSDVGSTFGRADAYPGQEIGQAVLRDAEKHFGGKVKIKSVLREGDPAEGLIDVAEEEGIDLIIVGNRGMTGAKRFLLGSVPNQVSHHAPCNVLIVHTTT
jgi:nucleotide-binding universal stress UspA family protein